MAATIASSLRTARFAGGGRTAKVTRGSAPPECQDPAHRTPPRQASANFLAIHENNYRANCEKAYYLLKQALISGCFSIYGELKIKFSPQSDMQRVHERQSIRVCRVWGVQSRCFGIILNVSLCSPRARTWGRHLPGSCEEGALPARRLILRCRWRRWHALHAPRERRPEGVGLEVSQPPRLGWSPAQPSTIGRCLHIEWYTSHDPLQPDYSQTAGTRVWEDIILCGGAPGCGGEHLAGTSSIQG